MKLVLATAALQNTTHQFYLWHLPLWRLSVLDSPRSCLQNWRASPNLPPPIKAKLASCTSIT